MTEFDLTVWALVAAVSIGIPVSVWFGIAIGRERIADEIEQLWDAHGGWIPGGAISQLEGILTRELEDGRTIATRRHVVAGDVADDAWEVDGD